MTDAGLRAGSRVVAGLGVAIALAVIGLALPNGNAAQVIGSVAYLSFPLVGLVVARRQPRNTVAWAFLGSALILGIESLGDATAHFGVRHGWSQRIVHFAEWNSGWSWVPGLFLVITIGLLHFPDGRPLSPRWRWLDVAALGLMAGFALGVGIGLWDVPTAQLLSNRTPHPHGWREDLFGLGFVCVGLLIPVVLAAAVSLVLRWRRSTPIGRQQIRWVATAGVAAVVIELTIDVVGTAGVHVPEPLSTLGESLGFAFVAVATGVAILRYRLYEIDRIISRTLGWTLVTALLVAVYVGLAAAAGAVIPARYGSVGVAGATLAAAALFVPVRRRIHRAVDRRFDRTRYDATRIVDSFAVRVRATVGTDSLDAELLRTVQAAVAPSTATIWLAPTGRS